MAEASVSFTVFRSRDRLSKRFEPAPDGGILKISGTQFSAGTADRVDVPLSDVGNALAAFGKRIAGLSSREAIALGVAKNGRASNTITVKAKAGNGAIGRTRDDFCWPLGAGVLLVDGDDLTDLRARLVALWSGFARVATLVRPSASTGIVNAKTGLTLVGGGEHLYLVVDDVSQSKAVLDALMRLAWHRGQGLFRLSAKGGLLVRGPVDVTVGTPERLSYEGAVEVVEPIEQRDERKLILDEGGILDTAAFLAFVEKVAPVAAFEALKAETAKDPVLIAAQKERHAVWLDKQVARKVANGVDEAVAKAEAGEHARAFKPGVVGDFSRDFIDASDVLYAADGRVIRVADVLANPKAYDRSVIADPIEGPDYGRSTAMIFAGDERGPFVRSHAHGGITYQIRKSGEKAMHGKGSAGEAHNPAQARDALLAAAADLGPSPRSSAIDAVLIDLCRGLGDETLTEVDKEAAITAIVNATKFNRTAIRKQLDTIQRRRFQAAEFGLPQEASTEGLTHGHYRLKGTVYRLPPPGTDGQTVAVASDMRVVARMRLPEEHSWTLLVEAPTPGREGHTRQALVSEALLATDPKAAVALLVGQLGVKVLSNPGSACRAIYPSGGDVPLGTYVTRTGWIRVEGEIVAFASPTGIIGEGGHFAIHGLDNDGAFASAGTLDGWKHGVARRMAGNPAWMLMASAMFAANAIPFMPPSCETNIIFHFVWDSTEGKTTGLRAAASIWGSWRRYVTSWNTSVNALEKTAEFRTHTGMTLDEIKLLQPHEAATTPYRLASERGRERLRQDSSGLRPSFMWETFFVSTGEKTLADHGQTSAFKRDQHLDPGAFSRVVDLRMPLVETLHESETSETFVKAVLTAATRHHGHAGPAYARWLVSHQMEARTRLAGFFERFLIEIAAEGILPPNATTQAKRVANHLAALAAGGALAAKELDLPWQTIKTNDVVLTPVEAVFDAAKEAMRAWILLYGGTTLVGTEEDIENLIALVFAHQDRFSGSKVGGGNEHLPNDETVSHLSKMGWFVRKNRELTAVAILPQAFTDAGWARDRVDRIMRHLRDKGLLMAKGNELRTKHRSNVGPSVAVYKIKGAFFGPQLDAPQSDADDL